VYALGALLYHLLSGDVPYLSSESKNVILQLREGPPQAIEQREPHVPPELAAVVRKAMARVPHERYATARDMAEDLRRFQAGRLVGAHRYSLASLLRAWIRRNLALVSVATGAVVVVVTVVAIAINQVVVERNRATEMHASAEDLIEFMLVNLRARLKK